MLSFIRKLKNFFGNKPLTREKFTRKNTFTPAPIEAPKVVAPDEKTREEKICPQCGKSFTSDYPNKKFCSRECQVAFNNEKHKILSKPEKICPRCGKTFTRENNHQIFCSKECRADFADAKKEEQCKPFEKTCLKCGKSFTSDYPNKKFCSRECQVAFNNEKHKILSKPEKICPRCGKTFTPTKEAHKFCSRECHYKFHNAQRIPSTAATSKVTFSDEPIDQKEKNYTEKTCVVCGKTFKAHAPYQVFCSNDCRIKAYTRTCPTCGKTFVAQNTGQKYCSFECRKSTYKAQNRQSKESMIDKICPNCGNIFWTASPNQKFCSESCRKRRFKKKKSDIDIKSCVTPKKSLQQWMDEAAQCGMSYGKYRAAIERLGHTFEELKIS